MKQQQALNCEQYSQIFSPIERKLCHQLRLSSLAALRLNMSWLDCVGEKKKPSFARPVEEFIVFLFICVGL